MVLPKKNATFDYHCDNLKYDFSTVFVRLSSFLQKFSAPFRLLQSFCCFFFPNDIDCDFLTDLNL